ncbi:NfeD family protein [Parvularcula lutaonensis]|uniref:Nodulation protein NfeD n=1 Tax=Parvularcula lutaonensis TaxID=491923 RepID=A0ABV7MDW6_9PROT|nr:nodulation protein NfeD [Parvularcula lutaonensis]GGY52424.1 serine protease [Parvularcula lutaonensis]
MPRIVRALSLFLILLGVSGLGLSLTAQEGGKRATFLELKGAVTPTTANYLEREISAASVRGDELVVIEIDTPGGLVTSMQSIVQSILASETPVVTYVGPQGARSASAGLYIMYAAHVSAMAPATNTGSATPIELGGGGGRSPFEQPQEPDDGGEADAVDDGEAAPEEAQPAERPADISNEASLRGKVIEDAVAYIKGLAELRGRNAEWAEKAVRPPSASITASEALELGVIEIIAEDRTDLLRQLDGRTVKTIAGEKTLSTKGLRIVEVRPTRLEQILAFFADPNVAAILLSLGTLGITVELWNPGSIFPGTFGVICLLLAFYSFQVLPENGLFLAVMGLGVVLLILEAFVSSAGIAGIAGMALLSVGLYYLFPESFRVSISLIIGIVAVMGSVLVLLLWQLIKSRAHGPLIGKEAIRGRTGRVEEWQGAEGWVIVDGERWRAKAKQPLQPGDAIKVVEVDGLVLIIKKATARQGFRLPQRAPEA